MDRRPGRGFSSFLNPKDPTCAQTLAQLIMNDKSRAIEAWLRQDGRHIVASIVNEDESVYSQKVDSPSMLGAQKEIAGFFIGAGFKPEIGWTVQAVDESGAPAESWRRFWTA